MFRNNVSFLKVMFSIKAVKNFLVLVLVFFLHPSLFSLSSTGVNSPTLISTHDSFRSKNYFNATSQNKIFSDDIFAEENEENDDEDNDHDDDEANDENIRVKKETNSIFSDFYDGIKFTGNFYISKIFSLESGFVFVPAIPKFILFRSIKVFTA